MYRLKAALIVALLISVLTGSVLYLSQSTSVLSGDVIEAEHTRLEDVLREKLLSAEDSLSLQANDLSNNDKLVQELGDIHDRLLMMTPDQLKQNSNNWNKTVFDTLLSWKKNRQSEINQHSTTLSDTLRADNGCMSHQSPVIDWWKKAPDLTLAFAAVPLNDGSLASILVAQGFEGKQLSAGKSYEKSIQQLDQINKHPYAHLGHFPWDRKMYISVIAPVMRNGNYIGTIVVGYELSREMLTTISRSMPNYVDLNLVYSSPKFGSQNTDTPPQRVFFSTTDENILKSQKFQINTSKAGTASTTQSFDNLSLGTVYLANAGEKNEIALSRVKWTWDETQETDVYIMSNHNVANARQVAFQSNVIIAGIIALIAGIILIILLISAIFKKVSGVKDAIAKAITSGEPIDSNAMAFLMGEDPDALDSYIIKPLDAEADNNAENWSEMMDFSDEANAKADAALAPEDEAKLKESADVEEAKAIYEEYMRLRKENNINTPMDFDSFLRRLQRNAAKIKEQHHCDNVTFQVHVSDGNVLLKPKIVKKS